MCDNCAFYFFRLPVLMGWANNKRFWVGVHDQATDLEYKTVHGDDMPFDSKHELYKNYCDVILTVKSNLSVTGKCS